MTFAVPPPLAPLWKGGWVGHSARTAVAAVASLLVAGLLGMPEAYWASITTIVVLQSTLGAAWGVSTKRLAGTALGAVVGGLTASFLEPRLWVYGLGLLGLGLLCGALRLDQSAYRFAALTFTIVLLIQRAERPAVVALHRFLEVSTGIAVALAVSGIWPRSDPTGDAH